METEFTPIGLLAIGGAVSAILLSSAAIVAVARLPPRRAAIRLGQRRTALPPS